MKRILFSNIILVSILVLTFNSCKKEKPDTETQSAVDNNICESEFTAIMPNVNSFGIRENGVKSMLPACPAITIDSSKGWPRILTIDYAAGCTDSIDGKTRKGQVICKFYSRWNTIPSKVTVTLQNYYVNNINYTADSITISRDAVNRFTNIIHKGKCISSAWTLEWASKRSTTQTAGISTPSNPNDDVFEFTGNAEGRDRNGLAYTLVIATPIVKRSSCQWIESGKLDLTPNGLATRSVNFGTGTCDNKATLIIDGNSFDFTLQ